MQQDGSIVATPSPAPSNFVIHRLNAHHKQLQPATQLDVIQQLVTLERKMWTKSDSWAQYLEKELLKKNVVALYATSTSDDSGAIVIAYLIFNITSTVAHIGKLFVLPDSRRQGIGLALVKAAVEISDKERRVGSVTLHVDHDNVAAVQLYTGMGFEVEDLLQVSEGNKK